MGAARTLDAPPSNVVPLRWTARSFVRAGVVFTIAGANVTVSGPAGRLDLQEQLAAEVKRRVDVFVKFAPLDPRSPMPRVALPGVRDQRAGACDTCGDAIDAWRSGMCPLCVIALQKALRQLGRIP